MKCPYCANTLTRVVDKRDNNDEGITRRRRECQNCYKRFTTYERVEKVELDVVKRDGTIEKFNKDKLKKGVVKAVKKRPVTEEQICGMLDDIEMKLLNRKSTQIHSHEIGKMVLERLKKLDDIAYMRFASVYKDFNNLTDFEKELNSLKK